MIFTLRSVFALRKLEVADLDRVFPPDLADDARDRVGVAAAVERGAGIVDVDAFQRRREAVGVALAAHLAVGDDVEAGPLLIADGEERGVVLRLFEPFGRHPPQLQRPHPRREAAGELLPVDQPVRLRIRADERGRKQLVHVGLPPLPFGGRPETLVHGSRGREEARAVNPAAER